MSLLYSSAIFLLLLSISISSTRASSPLQFEDERGFPKSLVKPIKQVQGQAGVRSSEKYDRFKLPENVVPIYYKIDIIPILVEQIEGREPWTAPGSVEIGMNCLQSTSHIIIHKSPDLRIVHENIRVMTLPLTESINVPVLPFDPAFTFDPETEFYNVTVETPLEAGRSYRIYVEFVGKIYAETERLEGLYRSSYTNAEGVRSILATTQFEPTDFRRMVPSFDEPHFKTSIKLRIGRLASKYMTLSNSARTEGDEDDPKEIDGWPGWVWDDYQETVPSPTYLVAIVVAEDYNFVEADPALYDKPVRTYGPTELIARGGGDFASETAARQLAFYRDTFEMDYQMHKLYSIAIPDFSAGAMENWGLNTYRIPYLLNFDGETTESERSFIVNILAHELAHQWFGNAVTCGRWHYLWLNEGFATYLEHIGWQHTHPEFESLKYFMNGAFQYSMVHDGNIDFTHPIVNDAVTTSEINSYFSRMTYEKGASLIRMMENFLGWETLRKGLVLYLDDMLHKGAVQDDLWRNLDVQAAEDRPLPEGVTVKQIMDTWTLQAGYPLVKVSAASASRMYISQERVVPVKPLPELDPNHMWYIPVAIATPGEAWSTTPKLWLEPNYALKLHSINTNQWLVVNPSATGYYRVLYDAKLTDLLLAQLNLDHTVFSAESRSQFLDDYLSLAFMNHVSIETALEFTKYLGADSERIVWGAALNILRNSFNKLRDSTESFNSFKAYLVPRLLSTLNAIGFRQEPGQIGANVIFRASLLDWSCAMEMAECIAYAANLYNTWITNVAVNPVPVDIQAVIYCAIVAHGDPNAFEFIFGRYEAFNGPTLMSTATQRTRLLNGLACTADPALITSFVAEILSEDSRFVSEADRVNALVRIAGNTGARTTVLNFLNNNLETLKNYAGSIARTLPALVANMGTSAELEAVTRFIEDNRASLEELNLDLDAYLATIRNNVAWKAQYEDRMRTWFLGNV